MKPIDIACRHTDRDGVNCGAEAGEPCDWRLEQGDVTLDYAPPEFHAERVEDAAAFGEGGGE